MHSSWKRIFTLSLLLLVGCAKDRTVEDFQQEQARNDLAHYQSVSGVYTGLVHSAVTGQVLGAAQINLRAQPGVSSTSGSGAGSSLSQPVLVAELSFVSDQQMNIAFSNTTFMPDSGIFHGDFGLSLTGGTGTVTTRQATIEINGQISDGRFTGTLDALGYSQQGGVFSLQLNGTTLDQLTRSLPASVTQVDQNAQQLSSYRGTTHFIGQNVDKQVRMVILQPRAGTESDFVNLLVPVKYVQVSLNYDASARFLITSGTWDQRNGVLTGMFSESVTSASGGTLIENASITCQTVGSGSTGTMSCSVFSTAASLVATLNGKFEMGQGSDPVDTTTTDATVTQVFAGTTTMPGDPKPRSISMTVVYPSRTRLQDITELFFPDAQKVLQATVMFSQDVQIAFPNSLWDSLSGGLNAIDPQSSTAGANGAVEPPLIPQLKCTGFYFDKTTKPFTCDYIPNDRPWVIRLNLHP